MVGTCYDKCLPKLYDGDLSIGEMSCVDRCVTKYLETHQRVGAKLQASQQF